jgi:hypothetical protein
MLQHESGADDALPLRLRAAIRAALHDLADLPDVTTYLAGPRARLTGQPLAPLGAVCHTADTRSPARPLISR